MKRGVFIFLLLSICALGYSQYSSTKNNCRIDTFKVEYTEHVLSKPKHVDYNIYSGIVSSSYQINGAKYDKFIFGDTITNVIALVRQDSTRLIYIDITKVKNDLSSFCQEDLKENVLLYFNKQVNDKWNVHIEYSYFWKSQLTYAGTELLNGENVYVYNVNIQDGYSNVGSYLKKIYYSKERGFVKFILKTHWFPVEANKIQ